MSAADEASHAAPSGSSASPSLSPPAPASGQMDARPPSACRFLHRQTKVRCPCDAMQMGDDADFGCLECGHVAALHGPPPTGSTSAAAISPAPAIHATTPPPPAVPPPATVAPAVDATSVAPTAAAPAHDDDEAKQPNGVDMGVAASDAVPVSYSASSQPPKGSKTQGKRAEREEKKVKDPAEQAKLDAERKQRREEAKEKKRMTQQKKEAAALAAQLASTNAATNGSSSSDGAGSGAGVQSTASALEYRAKVNGQLAEASKSHLFLRPPACPAPFFPHAESMSLSDVLTLLADPPKTPRLLVVHGYVKGFVRAKDRNGNAFVNLLEQKPFAEINASEAQADQRGVGSRVTWVTRTRLDQPTVKKDDEAAGEELELEEPSDDEEAEEYKRRDETAHIMEKQAAEESKKPTAAGNKKPLGSMLDVQISGVVGDELFRGMEPPAWSDPAQLGDCPPDRPRALCYEVLSLLSQANLHVKVYGRVRVVPNNANKLDLMWVEEIPSDTKGTLLTVDEQPVSNAPPPPMPLVCKGPVSRCTLEGQDWPCAHLPPFYQLQGYLRDTVGWEHGGAEWKRAGGAQVRVKRGDAAAAPAPSSASSSSFSSSHPASSTSSPVCLDPIGLEYLLKTSLHYAVGWLNVHEPGAILFGLDEKSEQVLGVAFEPDAFDKFDQHWRLTLNTRVKTVGRGGGAQPDPSLFHLVIKPILGVNNRWLLNRFVLEVHVRRNADEHRHFIYSMPTGTDEEVKSFVKEGLMLRRLTAKTNAAMVKLARLQYKAERLGKPKISARREAELIERWEERHSLTRWLEHRRRALEAEERKLDALRAVGRSHFTESSPDALRGTLHAMKKKTLRPVLLLNAPPLHAPPGAGAILQAALEQLLSFRWGAVLDLDPNSTRSGLWERLPPHVKARYRSVGLHTQSHEVPKLAADAAVGPLTTEWLFVSGRAEGNKVSSNELPQLVATALSRLHARFTVEHPGHPGFTALCVLLSDDHVGAKDSTGLMDAVYPALLSCLMIPQAGVQWCVGEHALSAFTQLQADHKAALSQWHRLGVTSVSSLVRSVWPELVAPAAVGSADGGLPLDSCEYALPCEELRDGAAISHVLTDKRIIELPSVLADMAAMGEVAWLDLEAAESFREKFFPSGMPQNSDISSSSVGSGSRRKLSSDDSDTDDSSEDASRLLDDRDKRRFLEGRCITWRSLEHDAQLKQLLGSGKAPDKIRNNPQWHRLTERHIHVIKGDRDSRPQIKSFDGVAEEVQKCVFNNQFGLTFRLHHLPGSGGTTLARALCWQLRTHFACMWVSMSAHFNIESVVKSLLAWTPGIVSPPVLLFLDSPRGGMLSEHSSAQPLATLSNMRVSIFIVERSTLKSSQDGRRTTVTFYLPPISDPCPDHANPNAKKMRQQQLCCTSKHAYYEDAHKRYLSAWKAHGAPGFMNWDSLGMLGFMRDWERIGAVSTEVLSECKPNQILMLQFLSVVSQFTARTLPVATLIRAMHCAEMRDALQQAKELAQATMRRQGRDASAPTPADINAALDELELDIHAPLRYGLESEWSWINLPMYLHRVLEPTDWSEDDDAWHPSYRIKHSELARVILKQTMQDTTAAEEVASPSPASLGRRSAEPVLDSSKLLTLVSDFVECVLANADSVPVGSVLFDIVTELFVTRHGQEDGGDAVGPGVGEERVRGLFSPLTLQLAPKHASPEQHMLVAKLLLRVASVVGHPVLYQHAARFLRHQRIALRNERQHHREKLKMYDKAEEAKFKERDAELLADAKKVLADAVLLAALPAYSHLDFSALYGTYGVLLLDQLETMLENAKERCRPLEPSAVEAKLYASVQKSFNATSTSSSSAQQIPFSAGEALRFMELLWDQKAVSADMLDRYLQCRDVYRKGRYRKRYGALPAALASSASGSSAAISIHVEPHLFNMACLIGELEMTTMLIEHVQNCWTRVHAKSRGGPLRANRAELVFQQAPNVARIAPSYSELLRDVFVEAAHLRHLCWTYFQCSSQHADSVRGVLYDSTIDQSQRSSRRRDKGDDERNWIKHNKKWNFIRHGAQLNSLKQRRNMADEMLKQKPIFTLARWQYVEIEANHLLDAGLLVRKAREDRFLTARLETAFYQLFELYKSWTGKVRTSDLSRVIPIIFQLMELPKAGALVALKAAGKAPGGKSELRRVRPTTGTPSELHLPELVDFWARAPDAPPEAAVYAYALLLPITLFGVDAELPPGTSAHDRQALAEANVDSATALVNAIVAAKSKAHTLGEEHRSPSLARRTPIIIGHPLNLDDRREFIKSALLSAAVFFRRVKLDIENDRGGSSEDDSGASWVTLSFKDVVLCDASPSVGPSPLHFRVHRMDASLSLWRCVALAQEAGVSSRDELSDVDEHAAAVQLKEEMMAFLLDGSNGIVAELAFNPDFNVEQQVSAYQENDAAGDFLAVIALAHVVGRPVHLWTRDGAKSAKSAASSRPSQQASRIVHPVVRLKPALTESMPDELDDKGEALEPIHLLCTRTTDGRIDLHFDLLERVASESVTAWQAVGNSSSHSGSASSSRGAASASSSSSASAPPPKGSQSSAARGAAASPGSSSGWSSVAPGASPSQPASTSDRSSTQNFHDELWESPTALTYPFRCRGWIQGIGDLRTVQRHHLIVRLCLGRAFPRHPIVDQHPNQQLRLTFPRASSGDKDIATGALAALKNIRVTCVVGLGPTGLVGYDVQKYVPPSDEVEDNDAALDGDGAAESSGRVAAAGGLANMSFREVLAYMRKRPHLAYVHNGGVAGDMCPATLLSTPPTFPEANQTLSVSLTTDMPSGSLVWLTVPSEKDHLQSMTAVAAECVERCSADLAHFEALLEKVPGNSIVSSRIDEHEVQPQGVHCGFIAFPKLVCRGGRVMEDVDLADLEKLHSKVNVYPEHYRVLNSAPAPHPARAGTSAEPISHCQPADQYRPLSVNELQQHSQLFFRGSLLCFTMRRRRPELGSSPWYVAHVVRLVSGGEQDARAHAAASEQRAKEKRFLDQARLRQQQSPEHRQDEDDEDDGNTPKPRTMHAYEVRPSKSQQKKSIKAAKSGKSSSSSAPVPKTQSLLFDGMVAREQQHEMDRLGEDFEVVEPLDELEAIAADHESWGTAGRHGHAQAHDDEEEEAGQGAGYHPSSRAVGAARGGSSSSASSSSLPARPAAPRRVEVEAPSDAARAAAAAAASSAPAPHDLSLPALRTEKVELLAELTELEKEYNRGIAAALAEPERFEKLSAQMAPLAVKLQQMQAQKAKLEERIAEREQRELPLATAPKAKTAARKK